MLIVTTLSIPNAPDDTETLRPRITLGATILDDWKESEGARAFTLGIQSYIDAEEPAKLWHVRCILEHRNSQWTNFKILPAGRQLVVSGVIRGFLSPLEGPDMDSVTISPTNINDQPLCLWESN